MPLNIKYRQLKAFALVVELGSFKEAADHLAVTQPSLSGLVKELELDLQVSLFERSTRRCIPTDAGRTFYEQIKGTLDHLEQAYQYMSGVGKGVRGKLSLAALPSLCAGVISQQLACFQETYPRVSISLRECGHEQVLEAVGRGEADIGVGSMAGPISELTFEPLFTERLMIVAPAGHPLAKMRPVWRSLEKFRLITMAAGAVERALQANNVHAAPAFHVEQSSTALAMVRLGMGVTVLPSTMLQHVNREGLVLRNVVGKLSTRQLGLIVRTTTVTSAPGLAFAALMRRAETSKADGGLHGSTPVSR